MGRSERISFLVLYIRSRYLLYILPAIVVMLAIATWWSLAMAPEIRNEVDREIIQRNLITSISVLAAVSLTFTIGSPWGEMDNAAGALLQRIRLVLFAMMVALVAVLMVGAGALWEASGASWMLLRSLLGWIGITLIASQFLGENYARLISIAWAGIAVTAGESWRVHYPAWAWSMQDSGDVVSWAFALATFAFGLILLAKSRFSTASD